MFFEFFRVARQPVVRRVLLAITCAKTAVSQALPLEKFENSLEVKCSADSACSRTLRSKTTLGTSTGIVIRGDSAMNASLATKQGSLHVIMEGASLEGILLTWDSDTYPDQLSSSGLACIDVRENGATAFIIKNFSAKGTCGAGSTDCRPFVVESRVYDAADPTGQTYSASVLRRANGRAPEDLIIPFSNFNRKGLRGAGRFDCVGAISIHVRTDSYADVEVGSGVIFTNSSQPLEIPTSTPTILPDPADAEVNATPVPTPMETPQPTPSSIPTVVVLAPSEGPRGPGGSQDTGKMPIAVAPAPLATNNAPSELAPLPRRVPKVGKEEPEEAVYGEIANQ